MDQTPLTMPGASFTYQAAREDLLKAEIELSEHVERVAAMRRALPPGPIVTDYEFLDGSSRIRLSDLFEDGKPYLIVYHVMFWLDEQEFCPMCSMWVDGWDGIAHHIEQQANIVASALAPVATLELWAQHRDWRRIRVLADADPTFARDTGAEDADGDPCPTVLIFEKTREGIRHIYTAHAQFNDALNRGIDQLCPTWHILDLLPTGRGDWSAANDYVNDL